MGALTPQTDGIARFTHRIDVALIRPACRSSMMISDGDETEIDWN
jgi:hypothetical protein